MFKFLKLGVLKKGVQTREYPLERFEPYDAFLGLPVADVSKCDRCLECPSVCPVEAIRLVPGGIEVSLDRCIFCAACAEACPTVFRMSKAFELSAKDRAGLKVVYGHG